MRNVVVAACIALTCVLGVYGQNITLPTTVVTGYTNLTALELSLFSKYDALSRPGAGTGDPTVIQCQLKLNKFEDLDPLAGTFTMDLYLRLQWTDPRLVFNTSLLDGEAFHVDPDLAWKPDIYFYNEAAAMTALDASFKLKAAGLLYWSRHFLMVFAADLDLTKFPYDSQSLDLQLVSYSYDNATIILDWFSTGAVFPDPISDPTNPLKADLWTINSVDNSSTNMNEVVGQTDYSLLTVSIGVTRIPTYYVTRYIIPLFVIALASSAQYWIDSAAVSTRVGAGVTLLLAIVSFMFLLSGDLPKVSYNTRMDNFVLACFFFIFFGLCEFAVVHWISFEGEDTAEPGNKNEQAEHAEFERDGSILVDKKRWIPQLMDTSLRFIQPVGVVVAWAMCFADLSTGGIAGLWVAFVVVSLFILAWIYHDISGYGIVRNEVHEVHVEDGGSPETIVHESHGVH
ncbi:hypothetical protein HK100_012388 [Physocladia obscura]|uniref:Neurotransmitter-gated ion-channel ligand-binding domain-containing protein n=1 Tax=Physocladia obscura TaxID=109957 RepID=A0AAD5SZU4_9FUNG|nr:hypothetical protein HK100_012388 [Physocladia obscura]